MSPTFWTFTLALTLKFSSIIFIKDSCKDFFSSISSSLSCSLLFAVPSSEPSFLIFYIRAFWTSPSFDSLSTFDWFKESWISSSSAKDISKFAQMIKIWVFISHHVSLLYFFNFLTMDKTVAVLTEEISLMILSPDALIFGQLLSIAYKA